MATIRVRLAGLALAFGMAGCGGADTSVLQAADGVPGADGEDGAGPGGGEGGRGGSADPFDPALGDASPETRACVTRNADFRPVPGGPGVAYTQPVFEAVQRALKFGDFPGSENLLERGYLEVGSNDDGHILVIVDPALVDTEKLQRRMDRLVARNAGAGDVRVEVQPACFGGRALKKMADDVHAQLMARQISGWVSTGPGLDSRYHFMIDGSHREFLDELERRYGAMIAIERTDGPEARPLNGRGLG